MTETAQKDSEFNVLTVIQPNDRIAFLEISPKFANRTITFTDFILGVFGSLSGVDPIDFNGATGEISLKSNGTNLKLTAGELNTIQDIDPTAVPSFAGALLNYTAAQVKTLHIGNKSVDNEGAIRISSKAAANSRDWDILVNGTTSLLELLDVATGNGLSIDPTNGNATINGVMAANGGDSDDWNAAFAHSLVTTGNPHNVLASQVPFSPNGDIVATNVQEAIVEVRDDTDTKLGLKVNKAGDTMDSAANLTFQGGGEVIGLPATPSAATAATSKAYVDALSVGARIKANCRVATTANINLASAPSAIDGITLSSGDRVLVKNQTNAQENGIYIFNGAASAMTRSIDMDNSPAGEIFNGVLVSRIEEGTVNSISSFVIVSIGTGTDNLHTIGVDDIDWDFFVSPTTLSEGIGIDIVGNIISVDMADFSTSDLSEGSNLYYTEGRVSANTDVAANTAARFQWDGGADNLVAATGRTSLGLGTGDSPSFSGVTLSGETDAILYGNNTGVVSSLALGLADQPLLANGGTSAPKFGTLRLAPAPQSAAGTTPIDSDVSSLNNDTFGIIVGTGGRVFMFHKNATDVYFVELTEL